MSDLIPNEVISAVANWLQTGSINIFGMPMAGKDTQSKRLGQLLNAAVIGGGDILRNSPIPIKSQQALEVGELIPTQEYLDIILPYFQKPEFTGKPLILSSVGRWFGEEESVLNAASQSNHRIMAVIFLDLSQEAAFARLGEASRDRDDDNAEILGTRFAEFDKKTRPVIEVYQEKGLLIEIDGSMTPDDVTKSIFESLQEYIQGKA